MENINKNKIHIAVDCMGGDFAPINELEGIKLFFDSNIKENLEIIVVGKEEEIKKHMDNIKLNNKNISIIPADEVITMYDDPVESIKTKKNSSMIKSIELLKNNEVDGFISAGNTGAILTTSTIILGRLKGVSRPSIGTFIPTIKENPTLLMDAGATLDLQPRFLYEYALMGSIYYKEILGINNPSIGLLNIGEESNKGMEQLIEAHKLLSNNKKINFYGNIEGRDILHGTTNLVICDGFTGNVILKLAESIFSVIKYEMKQFAKTNVFNKLKIGITAPVLKQIFNGFNYEIYGGVPLLGVKGVVIIGHGSSSPLAIKNMILAALNTIKTNICSKIEVAVNEA